MKTFFYDLAERTLSTYFQVFLGLVIASGFGVDGIVDISLVLKAAIAAIPSALAIAKGSIATFFGNRRSASLVPLVAPGAGIEPS